MQPCDPLVEDVLSTIRKLCEGGAAKPVPAKASAEARVPRCLYGSQSDQDAVEPGLRPIKLLPEDIHSIYVCGEHPTFHFHMHGLRLSDLNERLQFNMHASECNQFTANPNIR